MKFINYLILFAFVLFSFTTVITSCDNGKEDIENKDDEDDDDEDEDDKDDALFQQGIIAVNQGVWGLNNASLTYVDLVTSETTNDVFYKVNQRKLGDVGQDILVYGTKIYVALTTSATIEVIDRKSGESVKTLISKSGTQPQEPRNLVPYDGQIYVSYKDGQVARIDTTAVEIKDMVKVGRNPEEMVVSNGKLYVTNSGGDNYANPDKSVSVINLSDFTEETKIEVKPNPTKITADQSGNVFVVSMGDYSDVKLQKINASGEVTELAGSAFSFIRAHENSLYVISFDYGTMAAAFKTYDTLTGKIVNDSFLKGKDLPPNPSSLTVNPTNGDIFIGTYASGSDYTSNGYIYHFNKDGDLQKKYDAGIGPNAVSFLD